MSLQVLVRPAASPDAERMLHVIQGECRVSNDPSTVLTTILGSCVAACVRDPVAGIGGMNHFLLPGTRGKLDSQELRYGAFAMELLINELLSKGARRSNLEAKLFGGGRMSPGMTDVGRMNADFAEWFLQNENIPVVGASLRGTRGRRVRFWPVSGQALQVWLEKNSATFVQTERRPPPSNPEASTLELF